MSRDSGRTAGRVGPGAPEVAGLQELFPMMVVGVQVLLGLASLRPHQEMFKQSLVRRVEPDSIVTFVSHQWLSWRHPDPGGTQLRCLQSLVRAALQSDIRRLFPEADWAALTLWAALPSLRATRTLGGADAPLTGGGQGSWQSTARRVISAELARSFFWIDYVSVPQDVLVGDDSQLRAIHSIPFYIEQSSFFIVLCPSARHTDTNVVCDYESWLERGWCRFEDWSNVLSLHRVLPIILTESTARTMDIFQLVFYRGLSRVVAVACGEFSCCRLGHKRADGTPIPCDKDIVLPILEKMWIMSMQQAIDDGDTSQYLSLKYLETRLFVRSPDAPFRATWGSERVDDVAPDVVFQRIADDEFLRSSHELLRSTPEGQQIGHWLELITPVCFLGDERVLRVCVERGESPASSDVLWAACMGGSSQAVEYLLSLPSVTVEHVHRKHDAGKDTALHAAAIGGHSIEALLRFRADPAIRGYVGRTPLHYAAMFGHSSAAAALLTAGAPVNVQGVYGMTALHLAAEGFSLWGRRAGRLEVVQCLLAHRARTDLRDNMHRTALDVARAGGFRGAAELMDATAPAQRCGSWRRRLCWSAPDPEPQPGKTD